MPGDRGSAAKPGSRKSLIIIDGYNIIGQMRGDSVSLEHARDRLTHMIADYAGYTGMRCIVVFDGYNVVGNRGEEYKQAGIEIVFTKQDETADVYIERLTGQMLRQGWEVTVATGDAVEQGIVLGLGGYRLSAREFLREMNDARDNRRKRQTLKQGNRKTHISSTLDSETLERLERIRKNQEDE